MKAFLALFLLAATALATPQSTPDPSVALRAKEIAAIVVAEPKWADDLFDASFLKSVSPDKLRALCADLFRKHGAIEAMQLVESSSPFAGKFEATLGKGEVMPVTLGVSKGPPHSVVELWFGAPAPGFADFTAAIAALKKLPGTISFGVYELGDKGPQPLAEYQADKALAIGSAFKLYVLGALASDLQSDKRKLEDTVRLQARYRSLPSGRLQNWPLGSPLTLHTLAALMISESDNTAADHLLFTLGRTRVESMLAAMGNESVARNVPFLSTGEMFRMKLAGGGSEGLEYLKLDGEARRAYLESTVDAAPSEPNTLDLTLFAKPNHIDSIEWFASARDLARAMDWLRKATEPGKAEGLRDVLSINAGLDISKERFPFIGFKGGSEPGVLELSYLLRSKSGAWYALSCGWNDPTSALDDVKLFAIVTRAVGLIGKSAKD